MSEGTAPRRAVRVLPDVAAIDKEFDYLVPAHLPVPVEVGTVVRIDLGGRRVGGWVVDSDVAPPAGVALRPLAKVRGWGPTTDVVDLAAWAAWRWAGRRASLLLTASAPYAVTRLPPAALTPPAPPAGAGPGLDAGALAGAFGSGGASTVVRLAPAADPTALVAAAAGLGPVLVVVPSVARAAVLAHRLRRGGAAVAIVPDDWAQARAGAAVVVGARSAVWAPCPGLAAVVVVDAHDEGLTQEQAPTWNAVAVARERARRAGVPCIVTSPCPTLELLDGSRLVTPAPEAERAGWAAIEVVDRRSDDPRSGLYSRRVVRVLRAALAEGAGTREGGTAADGVRAAGRPAPGPVVCVLNRTGRARLLSCAACGELARCERCGGVVGQESTDAPPYPLLCARCGQRRPGLCLHCGSIALKQLRVGVSRAREELEALTGAVVAEVTAGQLTPPDPGAPVLVGTEAVLHRVRRASAVVFLDFDQELLAPRYRASEEALAMLARASRLVGGRTPRRDGAAPDGRARGQLRPLVVQTRIPDHPVLVAASVADPGRLTAAEADVRAALGFPPYAALALISGAAAPAYVEALRAAVPPGVAIQGPDHERWLVRAPSSAALADALVAVPRPPGRLRVEVDPRRL